MHLSHHEKEAVERLRKGPRVTVGQRLSSSFEAARYKLRPTSVRPSTAKGLERKGVATLRRPEKHGPQELVVMAKDTPDEMELWRRRAMIYDVLLDGNKRGQVAALDVDAAVKEARAFWKIPKRAPLEVVLVGPLDPGRA